MRNAFEWMRLFSEPKDVYDLNADRWRKFKLNFCTVTLSAKQKHTDTFILHRMFFPLLKYLNRKFEVNNYVWRAEIQQKRFEQRGERCIHFHFVTDKFIHWRKLRAKWNALQLAHGYRKPTEDPNSTDVHSIIREQKASKYFSKYLSKLPPSSELKVTCKVYGMSRNLSRMDCTLREEETPDFSNEYFFFLQENCKLINQAEFFRVYSNSLQINKKYGLQVARALKLNYDLFHEKNSFDNCFLLD